MKSREDFKSEYINQLRFMRAPPRPKNRCSILLVCPWVLWPTAGGGPVGVLEWAMFLSTGCPSVSTPFLFSSFVERPNPVTTELGPRPTIVLPLLGSLYEARSENCSLAAPKRTSGASGSLTPCDVENTQLQQEEMKPIQKEGQDWDVREEEEKWERERDRDRMIKRMVFKFPGSDFLWFPSSFFFFLQQVRCSLQSLTT